MQKHKNFFGGILTSFNILGVIEGIVSFLEGTAESIIGKDTVTGNFECSIGIGI